MVGWRLNTSLEDSVPFLDAQQHDGIFTTTQENQRFLFGYCNNTNYTLAISSSNIDVQGPVHCSGLSVNEIALTDTTGHIAASTAILNSTLPPSKLSEPVPIALGGTGNIGLAQGELIFTGAGALSSHPHLSWNGSRLFSFCNESAYQNVRSNMSLGSICDVERLRVWAVSSSRRP